jgi:hypothetical protein
MMKIKDTRGEGAAYASAGGDRRAVQVEEALYPSQATIVDSNGRVTRMLAYDSDGAKLIDMVYEYATRLNGEVITIAYDMINNPTKSKPQELIDLINS